MTRKPEPGNQDCLALFEKLSEFIDGELDERTCRRIRRHIAACTPCEVCVETLRRTVKLCRHLQSDPVPGELSTRLQALVKQYVEFTTDTNGEKA